MHSTLCLRSVSVQTDSRCPHVAAELLSHVTSSTGSWTLSRRVKFERSHMATILDSPAFSNRKFSLIYARSPYLLQQASFKYGWNPEACTLQITAFKFNPMKKTWRVLTKNPDDKKLKGLGRHVLGIREEESQACQGPALATSLCSWGHRDDVNLTTALLLASTKADYSEGTQWEGLFLLLKLWVACDDKNKIVPSGSCHQIIS